MSIAGMDQLGKYKMRTLMGKNKDGRQPVEVDGLWMKRLYELLKFWFRLF